MVMVQRLSCWGMATERIRQKFQEQLLNRCCSWDQSVSQTIFPGHIRLGMAGNPIIQFLANSFTPKHILQSATERMKHFARIIRNLVHIPG